MFDNMTNEQKMDALMNSVARPPVRNELGGGIYYTCHWKKCGETLTKWYNYCPKCGQKILWENENG